MGNEVWAENLRLRAQLVELAAPGGSVTLSSGSQVSVAAALLSGGTLILEGAIGVMFLAWRSGRADRTRDYLLLLFLSTSFLVIPIERFGMILCILGLAQCPVGRVRLRTAYLVVFVAMHLLVLIRPVLSRIDTLLL